MLTQLQTPHMLIKNYYLIFILPWAIKIPIPTTAPQTAPTTNEPLVTAIAQIVAAAPLTLFMADDCLASIGVGCTLVGSGPFGTSLANAANGLLKLTKPIKANEVVSP
jgi:hypothetical protein